MLKDIGRGGVVKILGVKKKSLRLDKKNSFFAVRSDRVTTKRMQTNGQ